ncbi:MAG: protein kinase [Proteobacteria bacterium]|nr:protein kinase [Pseudomonadota bacterium]MCP4918325.1 protein kinase [Pseudomonadota bacterium]
MPTEALQVLLSMEPDRLEALWAEFGDDDPDRFIAWLHDEGHIDHPTFISAESRGGVRVASLDTIGLLPEDSISQLDEHLQALEGYTTLGPLGRGGVGEVLVVRERDLGRRVALKRLLPHVVGDREVLARFYREAQIMAQLEHPGIPPVYCLEQQGGELAYTMKLVRGETLRDLLRDARNHLTDEGRLPDELSLQARIRLFLRACEAVDYAHDAGFMHRDLKPSNIMRGRFGEVYVMDWGVARRVDGADEEEVDDLVSEVKNLGGDVTQLGAAIGTPAYMAPEQADGIDVGPAADQYALGLILQELVTLRRARPGVGATELLEGARLAERAPVVAAEGIPRLHRELVAIVDRACAAEPRDRYGSVRELAADVQAYIDGQEVQADPDGVIRWFERRLIAHRHATLLLLVALAMLFFAWVSVSLYRQQRERVQAQRVEDAMGYAVSVADRQHYDVQEGLLDLQAHVASLGSSSEMAIRLGRPDALDGPLEVAADVPRVTRVTVALAGGEQITLPRQQSESDPREEVWYRQVIGQRRPVWGDPVHTDGGWVLPCSVALAGEDGMIGVAAVEVDADALARELLDPSGLPGVRAAMLLSEQGRVLATTAEWVEVGELPEDERLTSWALSGRSGKLERDMAGGTELTLVYRIEGLSWTYVVVGDRDAMLGH